jgi:hypothetical protein
MADRAMMNVKFTRNRGSSSGEYRPGSAARQSQRLKLFRADYDAGRTRLGSRKDNPQFRDHDIRSFDDREHVIPIP